jgi:glucans biosynthesis protein
MQRDRDFAQYQDIETRAELRPSAWVAPRGDWGAGRVELVGIPSSNELVDNVVAYWVPDAPPGPGESLTLAYDLTFYSDDPARPPGGRAVATRRDRGSVETPRDGYRYVVDFEGAALAALGADTPPDAEVTAGNGARLYDQHVTKNPVTGGWRVAFQVKPRDESPVELRAYLKHGGDVLTETWSAAWLP